MMSEVITEKRIPETPMIPAQVAASAMTNTIKVPARAMMIPCIQAGVSKVPLFLAK